MRDLIKTKEFILLVIVFFLGMVVVLSIVFLPKSPKKQPEASSKPISDLNQPQIISGSIATSIVPKSTVALIPNSNQKFVVTFRETININNLSVSLNSIDIVSDQATLEKITSNLSSDKKTLSILTDSVIKPYRQYLLKINYNNQQILNEVYLSDKPQATIAPSNNKSLSSYLPYETNTFKLSYQTDKNLYIFNFKFDDKSKDNIDVQYDKAKQEAIKFIQDKGIDINSIVIEWRFS